VNGKEIGFLIMAAVGSIGAIRMVTAKNVVHAALNLVVTLSMVGTTYLLLAAEFVAWVQILIYVGAIVVLLLFSLMLTKAPIGREALDNQKRVVALVVSALLLGALGFLIQDQFFGDSITLTPVQTADIGTSLFRTYILPFEVISVLLLAALIGAVVLARKDEPTEPVRGGGEVKR
jgi:NADH-quinone oxidoreductase subunit J